MSKQVNITELRIGRNIDGTPMDADQWAEFVAAAREAAEEFGRDIEADEFWVETHFSDAGQYNGQTEESAVVTVYWTPHGLTTAEFDQWAVDELVRKAGELAWEFDQETVAVVHGGRSTLVEATEVK